MNHYPHHIADFNSATRHLTLVERALYRDLIEYYYDTEKPIDMADWPMIERKLMARTDEEKKALAYVCQEFFISDGNLYRHPRCDEEIAKYRSKLDMESRAGKASASARGIRKMNTSSTCVQQESTEGQPTINLEPITNTKEVSKKVADAPVVCPEVLATNEFRKAWDEYVIYRKSMKFKPLRPTIIQKAWDMMASWGHDVAIESMNNTIRNGWQGMFEPKTQANALAEKPRRPNKYETTN